MSRLKLALLDFWCHLRLAGYPVREWRRRRKGWGWGGMGTAIQAPGHVLWPSRICIRVAHCARTAASIRAVLRVAVHAEGQVTSFHRVIASHPAVAQTGLQVTPWFPVCWCSLWRIPPCSIPHWDSAISASFVRVPGVTFHSPSLYNNESASVAFVPGSGKPAERHDPRAIGRCARDGGRWARGSFEGR